MDKQNSKKMVALIIMDGYGLAPDDRGNAIAAAHKPNLDRYMEQFPNTTLGASGLDVGLPKGQMGNSEVGHTNIGAGRVVYQELTRITKSIEDGDFFEIQEFIDAMENCKSFNSRLHVMGLLSDGGVHSHNAHLYAIVEMAKQRNLSEVFIHCFLDGRDTPPDSGAKYIEQLNAKLKEIGIGKVASVMGRYYAMDRDNRWERVKLAYDSMVNGDGLYAESSTEAIEQAYSRRETDEFIKPTVIMSEGRPTATIGSDDSVIFFNFRPDRAREITRTLMDKNFDGFDREKGYFPVDFVCMTQYDKTIDARVAFKPQMLKNTFGEYISRLGYTQLRIAETEKYAHVTFFFNGGVEKPYEGEDRVLIPSPKVATYDLQPEMSAYKVTDEAIKRIKSQKYDVMVLNFANSDMVGHTGVFDAAESAVEAIDACVGRVVDTVLECGGVSIITADHGNAEHMIDDETGGVYTAHTTNLVPFILAGYGDVVLSKGILSDITPTMLDIMRVEKPREMTGNSLIQKKHIQKTIDVV